jgi:Ca-activated chloride channel family protein
MTFLWPSFLWFLLLVPLLFFLMGFAARRRKKTARLFADEHLLAKLVQRPTKALTLWIGVLQILALSALLLAAARPVAKPLLPVNKAAVVIAIDASRSMLADDVEPSRLERARELAQAFAKKVSRSTQIGLVSFSDVASVLVPPTTDRDLLFDAIAQVEAAQNTSLASAVVAGVRMLPGREALAVPEELEPQGFAGQPPGPPPAREESLQESVETPAPGSIIIFSDGVTNVSDNPNLPSERALDIAARFAQDNDVKLYTLALGKPGGTVATIDGQDYFIPFEPETLQRLADRSEGQFLEANDDSALQTIVKDLGRLIRWQASKMEVSSLLSGLAIILMVFGAALSLRAQRRIP